MDVKRPWLDFSNQGLDQTGYSMQFLSVCSFRIGHCSVSRFTSAVQFAFLGRSLYNGCRNVEIRYSAVQSSYNLKKLTYVFYKGRKL